MSNQIKMLPRLLHRVSSTTSRALSTTLWSATQMKPAASAMTGRAERGQLHPAPLTVLTEDEQMMRDAGLVVVAFF